MQKTNNPLHCDPETGFCEIPEKSAFSSAPEKTTGAAKPVRVVYFTDPICSSCWGVEPSWRKLKATYGHILSIEYRMGGLLPDWSYDSGGISQPSDVAHHWDEVSIRYEMPIDGDVWLEDPLDSSYPPSIAFKAAQIQDEQKAVAFLRRIREMVFLEKKNITKPEHLMAAANQVGLNPEALSQDMEGKARELFYQDLAVAKEYGVRGFPTFFFMDAAGNQAKVYGTKPYEVFETTLLTVYPSAFKKTYEKDWESLFSLHYSYTAKEFAAIGDMSKTDSEIRLQVLHEQGHLEKVSTKNGDLWVIKNGKP